jgi:uncharacterized membrane protein
MIRFIEKERRAVATLLAIAITAATSSCNVVELSDYPCPSGGTKLTYDNFGIVFMAQNCNTCHSAPDGQRSGAPDDVRFDTHAEVIQWKDRIFARAADTNDSMPPGPDTIPADQRVNLANWLACGAP